MVRNYLKLNFIRFQVAFFELGMQMLVCGRKIIAETIIFLYQAANRRQYE